MGPPRQFYSKSNGKKVQQDKDSDSANAPVHAAAQAAAAAEAATALVEGGIETAGEAVTRWWQDRWVLERFMLAAVSGLAVGVNFMAFDSNENDKTNQDLDLKND